MKDEKYRYIKIKNKTNTYYFSFLLHLIVLFTWGNIIGLTTFLATFSLEGHFTKVHDGRGDLVCILFLFQTESKGIKGGIGKLQLLVIINRINFGFSLTSSEFKLIIQYHK